MGKASENVFKVERINEARLQRCLESWRYSTFQLSEIHSRGRDTAMPCPYGEIDSTYKPAICCKSRNADFEVYQATIDLP